MRFGVCPLWADVESQLGLRSLRGRINPDKTAACYDLCGQMDINLILHAKSAVQDETQRRLVEWMVNTPSRAINLTEPETSPKL